MLLKYGFGEPNSGWCAPTGSWHPINRQQMQLASCDLYPYPQGVVWGKKNSSTLALNYNTI